MKIPYLGDEENTIIQQIMLLFGFIDDVMDKTMRFLVKMRLEQAYDGSNNHSKESEEEWKVMRFDHLSK